MRGGRESSSFGAETLHQRQPPGGGLPLPKTGHKQLEDTKNDLITSTVYGVTAPLAAVAGLGATPRIRERSV